MGFSFKIDKVADCPKSRQSKGVVRMPPALVAMLATAVEDKDEWAIICSGERKERGYLIEVNSYRLPPQTRSSGHVEIEEFDLNPDDVLVIHSHHSMGAFFSTTDTSKLNPRFPTSIVVAHGKSTYLGFDYKGTGKVTLPCGSIAEIPFFIQPTEGPEIATWAEVDHKAEDLGDCNKFEDKAPDAYHVHYHAACGLTESLQLRAAAFGKNDELMKEVAVLPRPIHVYTGGKLSAQRGGNRESGMLWCTKHSKYDLCFNNSKKNCVYCPKCDFEFIGPGQRLYCNRCKEWVKTLSAKKRNKRQVSKFNCPTCNYAFQSDTLRSDGTLHCQPCNKDVIPRQGGSAGGWLKKYEGSSIAICKKTQLKVDECGCGGHENCQHPSTYNGICINCSFDTVAALDKGLTWCDECGFYAPFEDFRCEACKSLYCQACDCGHLAPCSETTKPPADPEVELCPCHAALAQADGYCSQQCFEKYEVVVEVEGTQSETTLYFCPCGKPCDEVGYCSIGCFTEFAEETEALKSRGEDLGDGCIKLL
jgi:hypothetical protein